MKTQRKKKENPVDALLRFLNKGTRKVASTAKNIATLSPLKELADEAGELSVVLPAASRRRGESTPQSGLYNDIRLPTGLRPEDADEYIAPGSRREHIIRALKNAPSTYQDFKGKALEGAETRLTPGATVSHFGYPGGEPGHAAWVAPESPGGFTSRIRRGDVDADLARHEIRHVEQFADPVLRKKFSMDKDHPAHYMPWALQPREIDAQIGTGRYDRTKNPARDFAGITMPENVAEDAFANYLDEHGLLEDALARRWKNEQPSFRDKIRRRR